MMRKQLTLVALGILVGCLTVSDAWAQNKSDQDFAKIKQLEGHWKGVKPDGNKVTVKYEIMSNGSAVMETLMPEGEPNMVTVYHMDGDKLVMTHYCSAGNQPKMKATSTERGAINFRYTDVTNLKSKSEGHMRGLKIVFVDENNLKQLWTWGEGEKETPATFEFERVV